MESKEPLFLANKAFFIVWEDFLNIQEPYNPSPLTVNEVITCFRCRWGVTYDIRLFVRQKHVFFQIMWAYLEQQSFPLDEEGYKNHINEVLEIVNRLGQADFVREWISNVESKPRIGRALSLQLRGDDRFDEFLV